MVLMELIWSKYSITMGQEGMSHQNGMTNVLCYRQDGKSEAKLSVVCRQWKHCSRGPVWSTRASQRHSSCSWPARLPETTGRSPFWHFPQSHCHGWCSCWKWGRNVLGWRSTRRVQSFKNMQLQTHLLTSMQKSPLMVPGLDSAGLVSPSITLPVFTTPLPSHT